MGIKREMGTERDWSRNSCYGNSTRGVISLLLWCTVVVPSFKNTASIFSEISFIQYFPLFSCKQYDVITDLICIIENVNISKTKKDISKRKTPFFCILKGLSNKHNFSFHGHLVSFTAVIRVVTQRFEALRDDSK